MKQGKLPPDVLAKLLARLPSSDPRVLVGPRVGEDAAVLDLGDRVLVAATDPITFATDLIGWYAVQVNANDVAVMGAEPQWFLAALMLPQDFREDGVAPIFRQLSEACGQLEIALVGGHTEVTSAVARPILVGCMLGEAPPGGFVTTAGAQPGDVVVLYGAAGVEGTAILAREAAELLGNRGLPDDLIARGREFLFDPGISVVRTALAAAACGVTAMHDPTEGGIATGLAELACASGAGLEVDASEIPVLPTTRAVCECLGLDPLGLIASGSLLATAGTDAAERLLSVAREMKCEAAVIGRVVGQTEGLTMVAGRERKPLRQFPRDELARFFEAQGRPES